MTQPIIKSPVTYLEMIEDLKVSDIELNNYKFILQDSPNVDEYLNLYREIGRDYIWNYRPGQTTEEIQKFIQSPEVLLYFLYDNKNPIGMGECDFSDLENIEIIHFGLLPAYVGKGLGKKFLGKLLYTLWQKNPKRLFLSTCGMDHPKAKDFYKNAGFKVFKTKEGEFIDYRYSDFYSMSDAPEIPHGVQWIDRQV